MNIASTSAGLIVATAIAVYFYRRHMQQEEEREAAELDAKRSIRNIVVRCTVYKK